MAKYKHIHKYKKVVIGSRRRGKGHVVYRCALPGCPHYIEPSLLVDKLSLCNRCDEPFVISVAASKLAKPHCDDCTKKKDVDFDKIKEFVLEETE